MFNVRLVSAAIVVSLSTLPPSGLVSAQVTDDLRSGHVQQNTSGPTGVTLFAVPGGRRFVLTDLHYAIGPGTGQFGTSVSITLFEGMTPKWASRAHHEAGFFNTPIDVHWTSGLVFAAGSVVQFVQDQISHTDPYEWMVSWSGYLSSPTVASADPSDQEAPRLGLSIAPNPAGGGTSILTFALPREEAVSLVIYDVAGRSVRTLWDGVLPGSNYTMPWNGKNDAGDRVEAGQYFARLKTASGRIESAKVTKLD